MSTVRVHNFAVSLDGFGAGADQSADRPFGHADGRLMSWFMQTATFRGMQGASGGSTDVDDVHARRWTPGIGVEIMGRNKFGPQRGPWPDDGWTGWWGDEPPFHTPVIVLTHHPREPMVMQGGTTFHFVDATPAEALAQARALAPDTDVRIGGGVETVREFLQADLVDHLHVVVVPIVLGRGERLWDGLEGIEGRFDVVAEPSPTGVVHLTFDRRAEPPVRG
ncbi:dihydrofolate reductase family protein [Curtobacterium sp. VKM Ac-2922]|uniref:dihydrofolate reductase family protein n=1 Tax=Curtobacterium sp. VKM Ac-2922 TaxID=2929475 RepID=UPI001FB53D59|nr:dihydrofolate reductase family protein [Curtobacterium sp. VKM Ac-2922]MCJ1714956.1 dihydrofolate reductase family protein [Curtobacterium sp. VKM Ac-2922]